MEYSYQMKEHKIEILCQMEDERDSPVEHCNAGPHPQFNLAGNVQSGLGGALGGMLNGLFGYQGSLLNAVSRCPNCGK